MGAEQVNLGDRVVGPPPRPESVGDRQEVGLKDGFQHQLQRRLDHPVSNRGNAKPSDLPRPAGLGDRPFPHRQRSEDTRLQRGPEIVQEPGRTDELLDEGDRQAVHAGGVRPGVARDPLERNEQRRRVVHEVEQVVEPAARIGRRPTVKLGLHLRYPPVRPNGLLRRGAGVHRRIFRHYSIHPFS